MEKIKWELRAFGLYSCSETKLIKQITVSMSVNGARTIVPSTIDSLPSQPSEKVNEAALLLFAKE